MTLPCPRGLLQVGGSPSSPRLGTGCKQGVLCPPWGPWLCGGRWEPSGNRRYHLGHAWGWGSPGRLGGTAWDTGPSAYLLGDIGQVTSGLWASISTSACDVAAVTLPGGWGGLVRIRMGRSGAGGGRWSLTGQEPTGPLQMATLREGARAMVQGLGAHLGGDTLSPQGQADCQGLEGRREGPWRLRILWGAGMKGGAWRGWAGRLRVGGALGVRRGGAKPLSPRRSRAGPEGCAECGDAGGFGRAPQGSLCLKS